MERNGKEQRKKGQRARFHDYCACGYYLITATVEEGGYELRRLSNIPEITMESLRIGGMIIPLLTELGETVKQEIENITVYHPRLSVKRYVIMPDHIHLVIQVMDRLERPLGSELAGFLGGCSRRFRGITKQNDCNIKLFQPFHDQIICNYTQLSRSIRYVEDNPRRYLIKKRYPHLFKHLLHVELSGREYGMMGNLFLLRAICLLPVRIHRRWSNEEFDEYENKCQRAIDEGAVVISPAIHVKERLILNYAIESGGSVIKISNQPLKNRYKPSGRLFDLCAEGRLLILAPWQEEGGGRHEGYEAFHTMNDMAKEIAEMNVDERIRIISQID